MFLRVISKMELTCSVGRIKSLNPEQVREILDKDATGSFQLLDVRQLYEYEEGHIKGALHIYVGHLQNRLSEIPRDRPLSVVCNVGHRASLAASILLRAGYSNVCCDVLGSMRAWSANKFPMTQE
jgi:hydroxyacylglutathione hydrolase